MRIVNQMLHRALHPPNLKPNINTIPASGEEEKVIKEEKMVSRWTKRPTEGEQAGDIATFSVCF